MSRNETNTKSALLAPDRIQTYETSGPESIYEKNVVLFSKPNLQGNMYLVSNGSYTSEYLIKKITPDNVFSLSIPPETKVKLFCGNVYDDGHIGSIDITNITKESMYLKELPLHIQGAIKSMIVVKQKSKYNNINNVVENLNSDKMEGFDLSDSFRVPSYTKKQLKDIFINKIYTEFFYYVKLLSCLVIVIWIALVVIDPTIRNRKKE